jgi:hypothetical protein
MRDICEEKGLPIATFNNHKMVETGEVKGLACLEPLSTTTYFVGMWEEKRQSRATFATIQL